MLPLKLFDTARIYPTLLSPGCTVISGRDVVGFVNYGRNKGAEVMAAFYESCQHHTLSCGNVKHGNQRSRRRRQDNMERRENRRSHGKTF